MADLVDWLRRRGQTPGDPLLYVNPNLLIEAADEIEGLRRWKAEALILLRDWDLLDYMRPDDD